MDCMYHFVFTPKYRRKAIYHKLRTDIGKYLRRLCDYHRNRHFWAKEYYVSTVGLNKATIKKYIQNQKVRRSITR